MEIRGIYKIPSKACTDSRSVSPGTLHFPFTTNFRGLWLELFITVSSPPTLWVLVELIASSYSYFCGDIALLVLKALTFDLRGERSRVSEP